MMRAMRIMSVYSKRRNGTRQHTSALSELFIFKKNIIKRGGGGYHLLLTQMSRDALTYDLMTW